MLVQSNRVPLPLRQLPLQLLLQLLLLRLDLPLLDIADLLLRPLHLPPQRRRRHLSVLRLKRVVMLLKRLEVFGIVCGGRLLGLGLGFGGERGIVVGGEGGRLVGVGDLGGFDRRVEFGFRGGTVGERGRFVDGVAGLAALGGGESSFDSGESASIGC
jgi:hypothetical protein